MLSYPVSHTRTQKYLPYCLDHSAILSSGFSGGIYHRWPIIGPRGRENLVLSVLRWTAAVMEMITTDVITLYQYHTSHAVTWFYIYVSMPSTAPQLSIYLLTTETYQKSEISQESPMKVDDWGVATQSPSFIEMYWFYSGCPVATGVEWKKNYVDVTICRRNEKYVILV